MSMSMSMSVAHIVYMHTYLFLTYIHAFTHTCIYIYIYLYITNTNRCYRLGQKKDVYVTRYCMQISKKTPKSIEMPIHQLQQGKGMLGKGSMAKLNDEEREMARQTKVELLFDLNKETK
jgi:hypothetical protein